MLKAHCWLQARCGGGARAGQTLASRCELKPNVAVRENTNPPPTGPDAAGSQEPPGQRPHAHPQPRHMLLAESSMCHGNQTGYFFALEIRKGIIHDL